MDEATFASKLTRVGDCLEWQGTRTVEGAQQDADDSAPRRAAARRG